MAGWFRFTRNHDHKWPSGSVTAFKAGMIGYVKQEVIDRALAKDRGELAERPEPGDPGYVKTPTEVESQRDQPIPGNPVPQGGGAGVVASGAGVTVPGSDAGAQAGGDGEQAGDQGTGGDLETDAAEEPPADPPAAVEKPPKPKPGK